MSVPTWKYTLRLSAPHARCQQDANYEVAAIQPRAAINLAQTQLDRVYGPGKWSVVKAVIEGDEHRLIVEEVKRDV